ncbi:hypothetical protein Ae406Ps2_2280c [Pseudonocardia sp. Ae406_Ps2]|nr:hypothetical protein Ae331Ps2_3644 [Pseudonocardia sp. Ae331_Ps2]OLM02280.1 hypothetical protein Ae406Ps2_2280c [Pseudonocardia sp. Ae406_Ps2]
MIGPGEGSGAVSGTGPLTRRDHRLGPRQDAGSGSPQSPPDDQVSGLLPVKIINSDVVAGQRRGAIRFPTSLTRSGDLFCRVPMLWSGSSRSVRSSPGHPPRPFRGRCGPDLTMWTDPVWGYSERVCLLVRMHLVSRFAVRRHVDLRRQASALCSGA